MPSMFNGQNSVPFYCYRTIQNFRGTKFWRFYSRENLADNILANSCIALYTFYTPTYKLAENILAKVADFAKFAKFFSCQNFVSYGNFQIFF